MMLEDIGTYLEAAGVGTKGVNIWGNNLPETEGLENVVSLFEYDGAEPIHGMHASPGRAFLEKPRLQVLVRNTSASTARTLSNTIFKLLDGYSGTLSGTRYGVIKALGSPMFLEKKKYVVSQEIVTTFSTNYEVTKELS